MLKVGVFGEDVRKLQEVLNDDPMTIIANAGPGSPGQETSYFGQLTRDAVMRFQERYRQEILMPNGLSAGTGIVGPSTIAVLSGLKAPSDQSDMNTGNSLPNSFAVTTVSATSSVASVAASNPNLKNLDRFLADIDTVSTKQGISAQVVSDIKTQIIKDAATTTDLRAAFLDLVEKGNDSTAQSDSLFAKAVTSLSATLERLFFPEKAIASAMVPFGGALVYPFYCICSENWLIAIEPLPPTYAVLLTYEPFSQAFLSHNIPATNWLLGEYTKGAPCEEYVPPYECITLPSEGMITPIVGSSPL
jgi:peptidoglycan hydrolase-like protein with peptidoglycan-binding domain